MIRYFIGTDPGKTGGVAVLDSQTNELYLHEIPRIGTLIDINALGEIFRLYEKDSFCILENVHSIANVPATTNFSLGNTCGIKETWLVVLKIPYVKIVPTKWQKDMWVGIPVMLDNKGKKDTKAMSLAAAQRFFPNVKFLKSKDGLYDAALMAKYGQLNYSQK